MNTETEAEQLVKAAVDLLESVGLPWVKLHQEEPDKAHVILLQAIDHVRSHKLQ